MSALLDTLDRFNHASSSIRSLSLSQLSNTDPGPFTAAILQLSPRDLLRDADEAEYGLFTFVRDSPNAPQENLVAQGQVGRREFKGATPLRGKRVGGRADMDAEPEVYVEAAWKYLNRFRAVKSMPQARSQLETLVDRLNNVRHNIDKLQASLEEISQEGRNSPKSLAAEEERRISELKSRVLQLRKRKEALASKLPAKSKPQFRETKERHGKPSTKVAASRRPFESPSSVTSTPTSQMESEPKSKPVRITQGRSRTPGPPTGKSIPREKPTNRNPPEDPEEGEHLFWSGGKLPNLRSGDTSSLLDEKLDMSGFDALTSPTPQAPRPSRPLTSVDDPGEQQGDESIGDDRSQDEDESSDSGEATVVISRPAPPQAAPATAPPSPPPSRPPSQTTRSDFHTPTQGGQAIRLTPSTKKKEKRVRVTAEVERICTNIWSAIPDLLVPGNNFSSPGKKPPNAKDTLAVLRTIADQPIPGPSSDVISSPSTRSTLSSLLGMETMGPGGGSPHQIMTAHVLLSLLAAPNYAMPLTALKALLASKTAVPSPGPDAGREAKQSAAALSASSAQAGTRALYGCVAKKLVKIDRGGGEQIVKLG